MLQPSHLQVGAVIPFMGEGWSRDTDYPQRLLHVSFEPDDSFLPVGWREEDMENSFHRLSDRPLCIEKVRLPIGEKPSRLMDDYDGVVVGGASFGTQDGLSFLNQARGMIIAAIEKKVPTLAFCLGHQLMGEVFGAKVEKGRFGREVGVYNYVKTTRGKVDELLRGVPEIFGCHTNHSDLVVDLPRGCHELAYNQYPNQAVRYADSAWGVQFHPERSKRTMGAIFEGKLEGEEREQQLGKEESLDVSATDPILRNFTRSIAREAVGKHGDVLSLGIISELAS